MKKIFENKKNIAIIIGIIVLVMFLKNFDVVNYWKSLHPKKGDFIKVGKMSEPRSQHEAILLDDGKVLVFGGMTNRWNFEGGACSADIYDPKTKKFKYIGTMVDCRTEFVATKLNNGKIIVTGGRYGNTSLKTTQIYNPENKKFEKGPDMNFSRIDHTATLLQDGKVLITGGQEMDLMRKKLPLASNVVQGEIYDPKTNKFEIAAKTKIPRLVHSAVLLNDGRVLIVGGGVGKVKLASAEIYDPKTNKFELAGNMNIARVLPNVYALKNGNVLISGGIGERDENKGMDSALKREIEVFNPKTKKFKIVARRESTPEHPSEVLLTNDKILFTGGSTGVGLSLTYYKFSEIYVPETNEFIKGKDMNLLRAGHVMTLLKDGNVLTTGSEGTGRTAELYINK